MMQKQILQSFFAIVTEQGWQHATLEKIAEHSSLPLTDIIPFLPSKERGFHLLADYTEKELFDRLSIEEISAYNEKEQAMEIILTKLEILSPFKNFLFYLRENFLSLTDISIPFTLAEFSSLERILTHYLFSNETLINELKRKALFGVYLLALDSWLKDNTPDLSPTLAKLDTLLTKGESFLKRYS